MRNFTLTLPAALFGKVTGNVVNITTEIKRAVDIATASLTATELAGRQKANTWATGGRPSSPTAGTWGFNSTTGKFEGYTGSAWADFH